MYETHISLLLTGFDQLKWGGSANKLHFIPYEKQKHLMKYYCSEDFDQIKRNLIDCMEEYQADAKEIFAGKGMTYDTDIGDMIIQYYRSRF